MLRNEGEVENWGVFGMHSPEVGDRKDFGPVLGDADAARYFACIWDYKMNNLPPYYIHFVSINSCAVHIFPSSTRNISI